MPKSAIVVAFENHFLAQLNDGSHLIGEDIRTLAKALHAAGIPSDKLEYDWHPGQRMMTAGQQVALCSELRKLHLNFAGLLFSL